MPRNSSGTYTLPSGINPVVAGTTVAASWANTTLSDVGSEVTNSLDRQGRGSMLAPLKLFDGLVASPGLTFSGESTTGFYRPSAGLVRPCARHSNQMPTTTLTRIVSRNIPRIPGKPPV